ncbi:MAG: NADH-ubiquinone oxidoreductase-F iron-sulfur binding region domain-containing protein, partial [Chitinivibrionales bacterium]
AGEITPDRMAGLFTTACIGMNDQEPAAIINDTVFTSLDKDKVKRIVSDMRRGKSVSEMASGIGGGTSGSEMINSMVKTNIMKTGEVILGPQETGAGINAAVKRKPEDIVALIKESDLRGRGGAGFPTGLKWEFCTKSPDKERYVVCNADEGEPGTFKDRVILTEKPELLFEGMAVSGYAIGSSHGILYLRGEYKFLEEYLNDVINKMKDKNLLGENIAGKKGFDFNVRIQFGAGAYVCGEESALIESAEGKRGEPRIRPPFPVQKGYKEKPTVVNNVETFCSASKIVEKGADWFRGFGTDKSRGTKVLSVSGDCAKPGIYEVEWGITVKELLDMIEAENPYAVQVGGPSGTCISEKEFNRKICYGDLGTGGSIIVFNDKRDILDVVLNFMEFFTDESCGSCVPCRVGNQIIANKIKAIIQGKGQKRDLDLILELGETMKTTNRCGLGQTSANPAVTTIQNFRDVYESRMTDEDSFEPGFSLEEAVEESCEFVGRKPSH